VTVQWETTMVARKQNNRQCLYDHFWSIAPYSSDHSAAHTHVRKEETVSQNRLLGINYILREITEGRMKDKAFRTRKRLVIMLSDLASSPKYQEVKKTAEDRERWTAINGREMP